MKKFCIIFGTSTTAAFNMKPHHFSITAKEPGMALAMVMVTVTVMVIVGVLV